MGHPLPGGCWGWKTDFTNAKQALYQLSYISRLWRPLSSLPSSSNTVKTHSQNSQTSLRCAPILANAPYSRETETIRTIQELLTLSHTLHETIVPGSWGDPAYPAGTWSTGLEVLPYPHTAEDNQVCSFLPVGPTHYSSKPGNDPHLVSIPAGPEVPGPSSWNCSTQKIYLILQVK